MNIMQGAFFLPCTNRSLTLEAPTPTNISTKSLPEMVKNGTPASPAMAFARSVLPVPGGPTRRTPFGMRPPRRVNFFGSLRKSIISSTSSLASSMPATSLKVTLCWLSFRSLALDFPKLMALPPPLCIWRMKKIQTPMRSIMGNQETNIVPQDGLSTTGSTAILTPLARSLPMRSGYWGKKVWNSLPSAYFPSMSLPWMVTSVMFPDSTS